jgi:hypothetical protein
LVYSNNPKMCASDLSKRRSGLQVSDQSMSWFRHRVLEDVNQDTIRKVESRDNLSRLHDKDAVSIMCFSLSFPFYLFFARHCEKAIWKREKHGHVLGREKYFARNTTSSQKKPHKKLSVERYNHYLDRLSGLMLCRLVQSKRGNIFQAMLCLVQLSRANFMIQASCGIRSRSRSEALRRMRVAG